MLSCAYAAPKPRATATASPYAKSLHVVVQRAVNQFPLECFYAMLRLSQRYIKRCRRDIVFPRLQHADNVGECMGQDLVSTRRNRRRVHGPFSKDDDIVSPRYWDTPSVRSSKCRTEKQSWGFGLGESRFALQTGDSYIRVGMPASRGSNGAIQMAWFNTPIT